MKTFNQFIAEAQEVHSFSETILNNWKKVPFVIRSTMWNRIFPDTTKVVAYHVTDKQGFENLVKRQGRKNAISTFTKIYDGNIDQVLYGIETEAQVLLKLEGKSAGEFGFDAFTARTDKGHRTILLLDDEWSEFVTSLTTENRRTFLTLRAILERKLESMVQVKKPKDMNGREKQKFIKDYLDATEAYVKKNADAIRAMFMNEIRQNYTNEIVLEYGKILKAYIMNYDDLTGEDAIEMAELAKKNKISYELIIQSDLENKIKTFKDIEVK